MRILLILFVSIPSLLLSQWKESSVDEFKGAYKVYAQKILGCEYFSYFISVDYYENDSDSIPNQTASINFARCKDGRSTTELDNKKYLTNKKMICVIGYDDSTVLLQNYGQDGLNLGLEFIDSLRGVDQIYSQRNGKILQFSMTFLSESPKFRGAEYTFENGVLTQVKLFHRSEKVEATFYESEKMITPVAVYNFSKIKFFEDDKNKPQLFIDISEVVVNKDDKYSLTTKYSEYKLLDYYIDYERN